MMRSTSLTQGKIRHYGYTGVRIISEPNKKMKQAVGYRMDSKLHGPGKVELCNRNGCGLYGIVKDEDMLLCFRHYRERQERQGRHGLQEPQGSQGAQGSQGRSLLRRRPIAGTKDY